MNFVDVKLEIPAFEGLLDVLEALEARSLWRAFDASFSVRLIRKSRWAVS